MPLTIAVITVSDRCAQGAREDLSGPLAADLLGKFGSVTGPAVVPDGIDSVQGAILAAVEDGARVVVTAGGTGITSRDLTPEATAPLISRRMPGIENLLRDNPRVPSAALSRGLAGIVEHRGSRAFVLNAPGSVGGVRDAVGAVGPRLAHIVEQLDDSDHPLAFTPHEAATLRVQNRGGSDGRDAAVVLAGVSRQAVDVGRLAELVGTPAAGAIVTFRGQVRDHDEGRAVVAIDYEAHPDADAVVRRIAEDAARGSGASRIAVLHRTGHAEVGDVALGAAVSAAHRKEALRVLEDVVEKVKLQLPVWKRQFFADGTSEWTGAV